MEVRVRSAELDVGDDAMAHDVFYLTTLKGKKLSEARAREVADRVHVRDSYTSLAARLSVCLAACVVPLMIVCTRYTHGKELRMLVSDQRNSAASG